jgi:hypothetical protein
VPSVSGRNGPLAAPSGVSASTSISQVDAIGPQVFGLRGRWHFGRSELVLVVGRIDLPDLTVAHDVIVGVSDHRYADRPRKPPPEGSTVVIATTRLARLSGSSTARAPRH